MRNYLQITECCPVSNLHGLHYISPKMHIPPKAEKVKHHFDIAKDKRERKNSYVFNKFLDAFKSHFILNEFRAANRKGEQINCVIK